MGKKLAFTKKIYDYDTEAERKRDMKLMKAKGYSLKTVYTNSNDEKIYTAVYYK